jgi:hypothetical protein
MYENRTVRLGIWRGSRRGRSVTDYREALCGVVLIVGLWMLAGWRRTDRGGVYGRVPNAGCCMMDGTGTGI